MTKELHVFVCYCCDFGAAGDGFLTVVKEYFIVCLSGTDPGFLPGEGAKGLMTLYGIEMSDF